MKTSKTLAAALAVATAVSVSFGRESEADSGAVVSNRAPLAANAFNPLPLGAIQPTGWLLRQEQIQAAGLTGHLDEFWPDVGPNSGWLGGNGESWERGPYYLDGLLPLAYQLGDEKLIAKAKRWVDWSLDSQKPDGQFGPAGNDDWWPRMVMLKVLTQYAEVTGDPRVEPFMTKYFRYELAQLPARPLRDWGKYRWQDNALTVLWLYNRTGDAELLKLVKLLHDQGFDWEANFDNFRYLSKVTAQQLGLVRHKPPSDMAMQTHGVNNAMSIKTAPIWWLVTHQATDRSAIYRQLAMLDKYQGLPNGMFSGDEHFAGTDPSQGIELCAVVETMFSYELAFAALGDAELADRLERIAFNALPATLSDDMWSHQYDQQPNQIACTLAKRQWSTNGPESNLFGLAPHFGCCTANYHQGWPKLVSALWMAVPNGGLAVTAYAPNQVHTKINGVPISIREETEYPFRSDIHFAVKAQTSVSFPVLLRVPQWAEFHTVKVNGVLQTAATETLENGFISLNQKWKDGDSIDISFAMQPRVSHWYNSAAVFERGPLVFSLPLHAEWTRLKSYAEKSADWQLTSSHPWNFAAALGDCTTHVTETPLSDTPFDVHNPAVTLQVTMKQLPSWKEVENSAGPVPMSPVTSDQPPQSVSLVPYGAAKLRITEFPYLNEPSACKSSASN